MNKPFMNTRKLLNNPGICRTAVLTLLSIPSLVIAHPGHFHPGEEDEFDALRANFLHLHGAWEMGLALLALTSVAVFQINKSRRIRMAAVVAFGGSLALIAAF